MFHISSTYPAPQERRHHPCTQATTKLSCKLVDAHGLKVSTTSTGVFNSSPHSSHMQPQGNGSTSHHMATTTPSNDPCSLQQQRHAPLRITTSYTLQRRTLACIKSPTDQCFTRTQFKTPLQTSSAVPCPIWPLQLETTCFPRPCKTGKEGYGLSCQKRKEGGQIWIDTRGVTGFGRDLIRGYTGEPKTDIHRLRPDKREKIHKGRPLFFT